MEKIPAVDKAQTLMTHAIGWSVMKWLREKKAVRTCADQANAALDQLNRAVKERWPSEVKAAYEMLVEQGKAALSTNLRNESASAPQVIVGVKRVKAADDAAYRARMDAEETFDVAEKQLSTALAREGCRKAILSWELHEKAIRLAEGLIALH